MLQHAWAEIEHDRNYKFYGKLPDEIQRRFALLAGTLELVDREFNALAKEIDRVVKEVAAATDSGNLDISINSTTLKQYLYTKFKYLIDNKLIHPAGPDETVLLELQDFGINKLSDLDKIEPKDLIPVYSKRRIGSDNFISLIRDIMIINDHDKYFKKSWKKHWQATDGDRSVFEHYQIPVSAIFKKYNISEI